MPQEEVRPRERDMVLGPTEYATILDETKGNVSTYVGPNKTSLSTTDRPVIFNPNTGAFDRCDLSEAIRVFPTANEGSYLVLKNPVSDGKDDHPRPGSNQSPSLQIGRKVNIPGPVSFPLWPGQVAKELEGHRLRSNQYLVVRIYNDDAAKQHWTAAVVKPQASGAGGEPTKGDKSEDGTMPNAVETPVIVKAVIPELTLGQLLVIKGTEVSFYIPPTGIEVVPDIDNQFVRDAVTLEQLEYAILLGENGKKRYVEGPAVVFPEPTETFVEREHSRKFRAIELNENMGLYLKVIADHEERGKHYKTGEELFITGREQTIYFPRPEHAIIKYGNEEIHYAVVIPAGEARYVLDKQKGAIDLVEGPQMFLADPRNQVLVRRVLDPKTVALWFPGNSEAVEYNARLAALVRGTSEQFVDERQMTKTIGASSSLAATRGDMALEGFEGASLKRSKTFTPPRSITLDTKYDGAVLINVWTGYAVQIINKTGQRRVVVGPGAVILGYDETLEVLEMSTGTPKSDDRSIRMVFLRVQNNKVSDLVEAETQDLVSVSIRLSYRVNFEGEPKQWFGVENYIKLLTDHLRSMIRSAIKQYGIEEFNNDAIAIIRDTILGVSVSTGANEGAKRPGRVFEENGMRVYDVEVLDVTIGDDKIANLLIDAQHQSVQKALTVAQAERDLGATRRLEEVQREVADAKSKTSLHQSELSLAKLRKDWEMRLAQITADAKAADEQLANQMAALTKEGQLATGRRELKKADAEQDHVIAEQTQQLRIDLIKAEASALVEQAKAYGPDVVAALQSFADKDLAGKLADSMGPLAILGGNSVIEVFQKLIKGTVLETAVRSLASRDGRQMAGVAHRD